MVDSNEFITESPLGTKNYWEDFYNNEIDTYSDSNQLDETWFGTKNTHKIIDWVKANVDKNGNSVHSMLPQTISLFCTDTICDIGCGNGYLVGKLADAGFQRLFAIDYSQSAIDFCKQIHKKFIDSKRIEFSVVDILEDNVTNSLPQLDVFIDKGTYDAICLMPDADISSNRSKYLQFIGNKLKQNGHFVIMSCNFTKDEVLRFMSTASIKYNCLHEFDTPTLRFGGKIGKQVTGLVFRKQSD